MHSTVQKRYFCISVTHDCKLSVWASELQKLLVILTQTKRGNYSPSSHGLSSPASPPVRKRRQGDEIEPDWEYSDSNVSHLRLQRAFVLLHLLLDVLDLLFEGSHLLLGAQRFTVHLRQLRLLLASLQLLLSQFPSHNRGLYISNPASWHTSCNCALKFNFIKVPHYAFSNITSCSCMWKGKQQCLLWTNFALCGHKLSAKLWSRQCTINKVTVYQKKESVRNRPNESLGIWILFCYSCTSQSNTYA